MVGAVLNNREMLLEISKSSPNALTYNYAFRIKTDNTHLSHIHIYIYNCCIVTWSPAIPYEIL